jgi:transposase
MLSFPAAIKVYLCTVPCDMRRSFDGLSMMAEHVIGWNPFSGHLLVFCNRRSDRVKILYWDRDGWAIWYKRLEAGTFQFPFAQAGRKELAAWEPPGPGLLAHVAVSKHADHLPLYRQEGIFERHGVALSRQTMCDWMRRCAQLVSPLFDLMKERVLKSKVMQTDDTPVGVLDPTLPRTRLGRVWTYVGDDHHPYTVYDYTPNRSRDGPQAFMEKFSGFLQADAYSGYDQLYQDAEREVIEVACWAHARRKFYEAQSSDLMRSTVMLAYIHLLYDVEREARDLKLDMEGRLALRQAKSKPILDDIQAYLERERPLVLPKSPEGQAIAYALSNWKALVRYSEDGDLEIDNNGAERSLRGIAVGRKNWLFFGSDNGGRTAAVLTSFITTCKRLDIDPFAYLRDIFERISTHPQSRLTELLPDQWRAAQRPASTS